ncbi:hypothetical protein K501DRAFT_281857, partial [Backusella circina FSU 941]
MNKGLDALPAELVFQVGSYLSISHYIQLAYTSRKLYQFLIKNNIVRYMNKRLGFQRSTGSLVLFTYHNCASIPSTIRDLLLDDYARAFNSSRSAMVTSWSMIHALHLNTLFFEKIIKPEKPDECVIVCSNGIDLNEERIKKVFLQRICHRVILLNRKRAIRYEVKHLKTFRSVFCSLLDTRDLKLIENCLRFFGKPIDQYTLRFNDYDCKIASKKYKIAKRSRCTRIPIAAKSSLRTRAIKYPSFIIECHEYRDDSITRVHRQLIHLLKSYGIEVEVSSDYYRKGGLFI